VLTKIIELPSCRFKDAVMESEFRKQEVWRKDLLAFLKSAKNHWKELIGSSFVAVATGAFGSIGLNLPPAVSAAWSFVLLVVIAVFLAFRDQRRAVDATEARMQELTTAQAKEIADIQVQLDQKKSNDVVKRFLADAIHKMAARYREVRDIHDMLYSAEKDGEERKKTNDLFFEIYKDLALIGPGEQAYVKAVRAQEINPTFPCNQQEIDKKEHMLWIDSKIAALRNLLEKRL
jgi:hypothetical protein